MHYTGQKAKRKDINSYVVKDQDFSKRQMIMEVSGYTNKIISLNL